jgi:hypothetical protein
MTPEQSIISCIGTSYVQPIVDLYERMHFFTYSGNSEIKVSSRENGYAASIIGLSVYMIESAINRMKYLENKSNEKNLTFFISFFKNTKLSNELTEIYILRDTIAHNHLWEFTIRYDDNFDEDVLNRKLVSGYGDQKYKLFVDEDKIITKNLRLNVNPMKISKIDVLKVFELIYYFFGFLDKKNNSYFPALNEYIKYRDNLIRFKLFLEDEAGLNVNLV